MVVTRTAGAGPDWGAWSRTGIVLDMVRGALEAAKKDSGGYVLDGLPRTMEQAQAVYRMTVELDLTADVALAVPTGRLRLECLR